MGINVNAGNVERTYGMWQICTDTSSTVPLDGYILMFNSWNATN